MKAPIERLQLRNKAQIGLNHGSSIPAVLEGRLEGAVLAQHEIRHGDGRAAGLASEAVHEHLPAVVYLRAKRA